MKLRNFLNKYGTSTTSNFDLRDIGKDLGLDLKVIMWDELLKVKPKDCVIMNLQTSKEKGSHWVAIYKNDYYFDPYGVIPTKEIFKYLKKDFIYNTIQVQPDNTKMCGHYVYLCYIN